ncbi:MAG TPA: EamA family transporter RarD [Lacisediminihabitans sp.]|jgi:chloramphenicol-sensitive protein RarD|nr:EamA family transporter RarD [Lacisediminihabitans sp.]HXD61695.1 EamA family transporter RarD [Lacisediminihabitans sp.]
MPSATPSPAAASARERSGIFFAVAAFAMWGAFPAYFLLLRPAGAFEIVDWRVLFSLAFCLIVITITRRWAALGAIVRQPRQLFMLALAAVLIFINWEVYVWAVLAGHVVETALGYFINPIVTVLLGVVLLRERLRMAQWVAVGVSAIAVLVLAIGYGAFPWVALSLAFSFGLYGLVKKRVGPQVDALSGLTMETSWLVPLAIVQLVFVQFDTGLSFGHGLGHSLLLLSAGVVTALPLLAFAAAARRLPLVYMGLIQYLTPVLQFVFGAFVLHEAMPTERWVGFGLVWIALIVLSIDLIVTGRTRRASALPA